ncbi:aminoglycoside phosphotransferase family protein [Arthrobacter sp. NicSoilB8]|uniref:aminoglycoside phosphotransferase family protein n=1 Tax=Arthrobacter sp. NicSoilB8 TaxID=2830998 RepID=UPI001CC5AC45|nr:aminoglycoside phosphotransferase family protein [Arthrobacter sp. NicSoilB8]
MSPILNVPIPSDLSRRYNRTPAGRDWLVSLPGLIRHCLEQWELVPDLEPDALPWSGHGGVAIPVRRRHGDESPLHGSHGNAAVLKVAFPHDEATRERHALTLWGGRGAVRLLAADAGSNALLLERLEAGRSLQDVRLETAVPVWGGLVRQLSVVPDDRPEWREIDHVAARAEQWSDEFPETWERLARPFPRWLLEAALEVCQTRGAVGRRSGTDVLVHADLHYLNILARPGALQPGAPQPGTRKEGPFGPASYAAIDPQPMIGEAEFAVAPVLWNRLRELPRVDPGPALLARCRDFAAAAGLDAEAARQWSLAREVENALWYASQRDHEGDLARSLWVASTLAGATLPDLPRPQELPEPGEAVGGG